jgi:hypothetical protein
MCQQGKFIPDCADWAVNSKPYFWDARKGLGVNCAPDIGTQSLHKQPHSVYDDWRWEKRREHVVCF